MSFDLAASAYRRFMGQYSEPLAHDFARFAEVRAGQRVLDVRCGPRALTAVLVQELGANAVCAIDPSPSFVEALRTDLPDVAVRTGAAEQLPWPDDAFDAAVAQLVVHFMAEPVVGLAEMARVTRPGGVVAACVWDHYGGSGPISTFWRAVGEVDPNSPGEAQLAGTREGDLAQLCTDAGLDDVEAAALTVTVRFEFCAMVGALHTRRRSGGLLRRRARRRRPRASARAMRAPAAGAAIRRTRHRLVSQSPGVAHEAPRHHKRPPDGERTI